MTPALASLCVAAATGADASSALDFHYDAPEPSVVEHAPPRAPFGDPGPWWGAARLGGSFDVDDTVFDIDAGFDVSTFILTDLEALFGISGWYINQPFDDAVALNLTATIRWHFINDRQRGFSIFGDAGIGILASTDDVPDTGTSFNFTPQAGLGATFRFDETANRIVVGARWRHISNGDIESNNPGRDSIYFYAGIQFPF